MFDPGEIGVLYTEHSDLRAGTPLASLWSYEARTRGRDRQPVARNGDGNLEYWLPRSDPLLNSVLPGTCVSLVVNFGETWSAGRSIATTATLPAACVVGQVTQPRILRVGRRVDAFGAVLPPALAASVFRTPASELVDRIVPLRDLWAHDEVEKILELLFSLPSRQRLFELGRQLMLSMRGSDYRESHEHVAAQLITVSKGYVSVSDLAKSRGLSRQVFARRFAATAGLTPKLFARIARFQGLVRALLSSDVAEWAGVASAAGFYDQSHMINEFREFAGTSPTVFFRPRGERGPAAGRSRPRGRPSEWSVAEHAANLANV